MPTSTTLKMTIVLPHYQKLKLRLMVCLLFPSLPPSQHISSGVVCEALSFITHSSKASVQGRTIASKLKENLSRQQFEIVLQAKVGNKVVLLLLFLFDSKFASRSYAGRG
jgi:hypothetical protein